MKFYSKSKAGFFDTEIHGENIPADAVELNQDEYNALLDGQSNGKIIVSDSNGNPVLSDPIPATYEELLESAKTSRAKAYNKESDPLFFKSQRGEATQEEWIAKVEEIKARYPDPVHA